MARSIWTGSVAFGLVNVPVKLYTAVTPKSVKFNQISGKTGAKIKQKRFDESTDLEVEFGDIVKGYEITPGRYVTITTDELDSVAPKKTKTMEIDGFVPIEQIDPMIYDKAYNLEPGTGASKSYKMLAQAMEQVGRVGIGKVVLRSKEQLVALRAIDGVLVMSTMVFADEVNGFSFESDAGDPTEREVAMATQLIESLTDDFDHAGYRDEYRDQVLAMIEAKAAGETIQAPTVDVEPAATPDLMASLEASLAAAKDKKKAAPKPATKKRAAKTAA